MIEELAEITPQRPLEEVVKECDIVFSDGVTPINIESIVTPDPFKSALLFSRYKRMVCLAVFGSYFTVIWPDARWMRSLRLYQSLQE